MNDEQSGQGELTLDAFLVPSLDAAVEAWYEARHRFQNEPVRQNQDNYDAAVNELGQALSEWSAQLPGFREQLSLWLDSHPEY
jgi:hypothetical protein